MRFVKTFDDVNKAIKELFDFKDLFTSKNINMSGRRIQNASPGLVKGDYVTLEQLPTVKESSSIIRPKFYTIVFSKEGILLEDEVIPPFVVGNGREGIPHQVWLVAKGFPTGGPLRININVRTYPSDEEAEPVDTEILFEELVLEEDETKRVYTSHFIDRLQHLQNLCEVYPLIIEANGASQVSIGVVVKSY